MDIAIMALAVLIGLSIGALIGYVVRRLVVGRRYEAAKQEASGVLSEAREQKRALLLEAKEEGLQIRAAAENELRERRAELQTYERRLANREENADRRATNLERKETELNKKNQETDSLRTELEDLKGQELTRLEEIANLSVADAIEELMRRTEDEIQHEVAIRYRDAEQRARDEANDKARNILGEAIQRLASEVVSGHYVNHRAPAERRHEGSSDRPRGTEHSGNREGHRRRLDHRRDARGRHAFVLRSAAPGSRTPVGHEVDRGWPDPPGQDRRDSGADGEGARRDHPKDRRTDAHGTSTSGG